GSQCVTARASRPALTPEGLPLARAPRGPAGREELLGPLVMQRDPVALVQDLVVLDAGPVEAFLHLVERLREERLVLRPDRVVEDKEQPPMVSFRVCVVQDERAGVANVPRAARVRRETEDDLLVDRVRERR